MRRPSASRSVFTILGEPHYTGGRCEMWLREDWGKLVAFQFQALERLFAPCGSWMHTWGVNPAFWFNVAAEK